MVVKKKTKPNKQTVKKTTPKLNKQTVKKTAPKVNKQAKAPSKKLEFDKAWRDYNASLHLWKESLTQWQKATTDTLRTYHDACQRAIESDSELLKKVSESWEKTWGELGPEYIKQQNKLIENIFKETNIDGIKNFNDQWDKFLSSSGDDSIKAYQEAIKRFNETWKSAQA
ncbi:MAG TPA: hypothetical protein VMW74_10340 [Nitrosopumilaceae archaeon]|nr:hypothetical protein [Nitrosopumilaceae archaeon]